MERQLHPSWAGEWMKVGRLYWLLAIAILVSYFALVGPGTGHRLELSDDESEQFGSDLVKSTSYLPVPTNEDLETSHLAPSMWSSPTWPHVPDADLLSAVAQLNSAHLWLSLQPSSLTPTYLLFI